MNRESEISVLRVSAGMIRIDPRVDVFFGVRCLLEWRGDRFYSVDIIHIWNTIEESILLDIADKCMQLLDGKRSALSQGRVVLGDNRDRILLATSPLYEGIAIKVRTPP